MSIETPLRSLDNGQCVEVAGTKPGFLQVVSLDEEFLKRKAAADTGIGIELVTNPGEMHTPLMGSIFKLSNAQSAIRILGTPDQMSTFYQRYDDLKSKSYGEMPPAPGEERLIFHVQRARRFVQFVESSRR